MEKLKEIRNSIAEKLGPGRWMAVSSIATVASAAYLIMSKTGFYRVDRLEALAGVLVLFAGYLGLLASYMANRRAVSKESD